MVNISRSNEKIIVKPAEKISASNAGEFKGYLQYLVDSNPEELVVDLEGVEILDSVIIGAFVATYNLLRKNNGKLVLINVDKSIFGVLKTMRLHHYFTISEAPS